MLKFFRKAVTEAPASAPGPAPRARREEIECSATLCAGNAFYRARLCDVSKTGCKIRVARPMLPGDKVQIALEAHQSLGGTIRWCRDGRAGIQFARQLGDFELLNWRAALADAREKEAQGVAKPNFWGELVEGPQRSDRDRAKTGN